jgi:hypothetical protein
MKNQIIICIGKDKIMKKNGILKRKQRYATYLKNAANFLVA